MEASAPGTLLADHLGAQRAAGRILVVGTDHGEEQLVGDADRQEKVHIDAGVGELAEGSAADQRAPRQGASAAAPSGRGRKATASRSATAGASPPASSTGMKQPPGQADNPQAPADNAR
jgi:hypothetical protein